MRAPIPTEERCDTCNEGRMLGRCSRRARWDVTRNQQPVGKYCEQHTRQFLAPGYSSYEATERS